MKVEAEEYAREVLIGLYDQLGTLHGETATLISTVRNGLERLSASQTTEPDQER